MSKVRESLNLQPFKMKMKLGNFCNKISTFANDGLSAVKFGENNEINFWRVLILRLQDDLWKLSTQLNMNRSVEQLTKFQNLLLS